MASSSPVLILTIFLVFFNEVSLVASKIVSGEINTREDWAFVTRFCFKDSVGQMQYSFEYPTEYEVQNILLYFDTQWPRVYPKHTMGCKEKENNLYRGNNQVINLTLSYVWSGCIQQTKENVKKLLCRGDRRFLSIRARWWYIAVSNCKATKGLKLRYFLNLTNGDTFWTMHFSADEKEIIKTDIFFLIVFIIVLLLALHLTYVLIGRRLFHYTYKLFLASLALEVISLTIHIGYYVDYGKTGRSKYAAKVFGNVFHYTAHIVFLLLLILLAKGWTVTRGRISSSGQVKLSAFCTLYSVCFAVLFIFEAVFADFPSKGFMEDMHHAAKKVFDPGQVLYIYESPAGIGICVLRVIAWLWFCYGTFFTLKHYPSKSAFYYPFWFFYTAWFLAGPIIVVVSTFVISAWAREQVVNGIEWGVSFLAHIFFLVITRPSAANKNFPFHIRTNQIGIMNNLSGPMQAPGIQAAIPSFSSYSPAYPPLDYSQHSGNFTDIAAMFTASTSAKPPAPMPNGLYRNGVNGTVNQNGGSYPMRLAPLGISALSAPSEHTA